MRILYRCTVKDCKHCKAVDVPFNLRPAFVAGAPKRREFDRGALAVARANSYCPTHPQAYLDSQTVQGTYSESRLCDPRCTGAIGPNCSCQCGGANHGCAWL